MQTIQAHAKLNLALAVAPPEPPHGDRPGWHRIVSWFHAVDLHDTIHVDTEHTGFEAAWIDDTGGKRLVNWPTERDLGYRALAALGPQLDPPTDARIVIEKHIPAGAGLGGGSSDAAGILLALNGAADAPLPHDRLAEIGASIGSDVPFFLDRVPPRPALVRAFGDQITRLDPIDRSVILVIPPFGCSTPDIYRAFDSDPTSLADFDDAEARIRSMVESGSTDGLFNDLEGAGCTVAPRLGVILEKLRRAVEHPVHMTGSGSAIFILCDHAEREGVAERARATVGRDCRVIQTVLV